MDNFPLYIFVFAVLHVTEEYVFPGGFMEWAKGKIPRVAERITVKMAIVVNGIFLLLCFAGVLFGGRFPMFALSIAGLILVNGIIHVLSSIVTKSYSPGLITSLVLYIPYSIYSFFYFNISITGALTLMLYGFLYHLYVPVFLFSPFNKPKTAG